MGDQEDNKHNAIIDAVNDLADTKSGVVFLTWLKKRCFFETSTIVGNVQTHEINAMGTIFNEAERRIYLDVRRMLKPHLRQRVEK